MKTDEKSKQGRMEGGRGQRRLNENRERFKEKWNERRRKKTRIDERKWNEKEKVKNRKGERR